MCNAKERRKRNGILILGRSIDNTMNIINEMFGSHQNNTCAPHSQPEERAGDRTNEINHSA